MPFFPDTPIATTQYPGLMPSKDVQKQRLFIDPIADYGCKFDHRVVFDGATTGGTGIITSATIAFVAGDIGKRIVLAGAGAGGAQYVGTITTLNSGTSANVTPNTTTTVSTAGLQVHTDDLAAWTTLIGDVNASVYPGVVIAVESPNGTTAFGASTFTGRSGISSFLPTINKQVNIRGYGGSHTSDIGDYTKAGGCGIAFVGTSQAPTAFGAVMTIAPVAGATNQNLKQVIIEHFFIDCRNGQQPVVSAGANTTSALKGLSLQSCVGFELNDFFVMDPAAVGIEFLVISPGTAGALGEAKDCSRGMVHNVGIRALDNPTGAVTTAITTSSAITLTASGQSLTVTANSLPTAGYIWVMTTSGIILLVNYTAGGGTTTLTGCSVSAQDAIGASATVSGSNIVQAVPGNACALKLDGDATANANFIHFDAVQISHGTTYGPAAIELCNSDSNLFTEIVINGGSNTSAGAINRQTKPGVRMNGSSAAAVNGLSARNNVFKDGSPGAGGISGMGVNNAGALLTVQSGPTYWHDMNISNGEPIPTVEGSAPFFWTANGGLMVGVPPPVAALSAGQAISAAAATLLTGSLIGVPPQGFQVGMTLRWTIIATKGAVGTAARTFNIRIGTTGTVSDAVVAAFTSALGTAVADVAVFQITMTIVTLGATAAAVAQFWMTHNLEATGWSTTTSQAIVGTMSTFNSTTAQQFISASLTTGAAETATINACFVEVLKPGNP